MAKFPVSCPNCQAQYRVAESLVGRRARCRSCRTSFVLLPADGPLSHRTYPWPWAVGSREDGSTPGEDESAEVWKPGDVILGRYEVREVFTGGGMGLVYRVWHRGWNLELAVKCPRPEHFRDERDKENFER